MRDKMQDDVCVNCGSPDVWMEDDAPKWLPYDAWYCPECCGRTEVETRAEYLAAHDDDPRDDPAVERAVGANTQEGE